MKTAETRIKIALGRNKDLQERIERKEYVGRTIPYGYKLKDRQLIIDKEVSHIVYLIFDLYDKGFSNTKIANYLNDRCILNPSVYKVTNEYIGINSDNEGKLWNKSNIRKIIQNKVYNGYYHYSNEKTHKEIISDELFKRVNERRIQKQNYSGNDFYDYNGNEFNSKVYCKECGRVFTVETSNCRDGKTKYLRCSSYDTRKHLKCACGNRTAIRYDELKGITDMFIQQEIFSKIDSKELEELYHQKLKSEDITNHRIYMKQERELLKRKIANLEIKQCNENNLIEKLESINNKELYNLYNNRLAEVERLIKEVYTFGRTWEIKKSEYFVDKFIIDTFIERITIDKLNGNNRNVLIELK